VISALEFIRKKIYIFQPIRRKQTGCTGRIAILTEGSLPIVGNNLPNFVGKIISRKKNMGGDV